MEVVFIETIQANFYVRQQSVRIEDENVYLLCQRYESGLFPKWIRASSSRLFDIDISLPWVLLFDFLDLTWHHWFVNLWYPFSCKWCSGPLLCMTPTQDISSRLVSERLAVSRPNQSFLLFNRLLAVGELHRFWKVFIGVCWKFSFGKFQTRLSLAGAWETQEMIGNEVAVYTMAVEMKDKTSGYLVFTQGRCSDILSAYLTGVDGIWPADW